MKNRIFLAALAAPAIAFASQQQPNQNTSVTITNLSDTAVQIWVNGENRVLASDSSLRQPCIQNEAVELMLQDTLSYIECGEKKEISQ